MILLFNRKKPKDWQDLASLHQGQKLIKSKQEHKGETWFCSIFSKIYWHLK